MIVMPEGWGEVANGEAFVLLHGEAQIVDYLQQNSIAAIEAWLQDEGHIPPTAAITEFRMIRDNEVGFRCFYLLA